MHKFGGILSLSLQTFDENQYLSMTILSCTEHISFKIHPNEIKLRPADRGDLKLQFQKILTAFELILAELSSILLQHVSSMLKK